MQRARMSVWERKAIAILDEHVGKENAIPMAVLAKELRLTTRETRYLILIVKFRRQVPVMSHKKGYFLVQDTRELEDCCTMFRRRALTSLKNESVLKKVSLQELLGEVVFDFEAKAEKEVLENLGLRHYPAERVKIPAGYDVVAAVIDRIHADPEKYKEQLQKLRPLFIQRGKVKQLEEAAERIKALCMGLEG